MTGETPAALQALAVSGTWRSRNAGVCSPKAVVASLGAGCGWAFLGRRLAGGALSARAAGALSLGAAHALSLGAADLLSLGAAGPLSLGAGAVGRAPLPEGREVVSAQGIGLPSILSMAATNLPSCGVTRVKDRPERPARPVRPMRWM